MSRIPAEDVTTQEGILGGMLVSDILNDGDLVAVSREDADIIQAYIALGDWNDEGNTDCLSNCEVIFEGHTIKYHSGCGREKCGKSRIERNIAYDFYMLS